MTDDTRMNGKEATWALDGSRGELLADLAETLAELFRAVEDRHPESAEELGRWVEGLGAAIARTLTQEEAEEP